MSRIFQVAFEIGGRLGAGFSSAFSGAASQIRTLGSQSVALRGNLRNLDEAYRRGTISLASYQQAQARLRAQLEATQRAQARLLAAQTQQNEANRRAGDIKGKMVETAVMAAPLVLGAKAAIDFETAMGGVAKQVQGARDDNGNLTQTYYEMQTNVMQLSRELRMMPNEVANITAASARMGIEGKDALNEFVKMSVQMGVAFEGNGELIAEQMAKIANIRGIKINTSEGRQQLKDLADTINYLDDKTIAKGPEIIEVLQSISGTATQSSFSNGELSALATTMLALGKPAAVAATGLNALMNRIATAPTQAKPFQESLAALNIDAKQLQSSYMTDSKGTLFGLLDKINGLGKAEQADILTGLFGAEYQDDISALAAGIDTLRGSMNMLNDSARQGSMDKEFAAKMKLTASSLDAVKQSSAETAISLGQVFLPSIVQIAGAFQGGAMHLAAFRQEHPALTNAIVLTSAGLIGFRLAWLATTFVVNQYQATAAGVRLMLASQNAQLVINNAQMLLTGTTTRAAAIAQYLLNAAMAANPIGLAIGAVALLVGGLYLLYQHFDIVRNSIDGAWQRFAETFPNASGFLQTIGDKVSWLANKFKGLIGLQQESSQSGLSGVGSVPYAAHATGGIFNRPHLGLVAEAGYPEAIIPINNSARARTLYQQTGELLGMDSSNEGITVWQKAEESLGRSGMPDITLTFAPVIHGSGPEIMPELKRQQESFFEQFQELMHDKGRVSYG